jgi:hypothetical protein
MRKKIPVFIVCLFIICVTAHTQPGVIDKENFFTDETVFKAEFITSLGRMLNSKHKEGAAFPATFICKINSTEIKERVILELRGKFRRRTCIIPPLKVDFKIPSSKIMAPLGSLKLVNCCKPMAEYDQYLLREYLVYKIYNLFTDKSFRVRLIDLTYKDSTGKKKEINQHAFFIEDLKDLAKRHNMVEWKNGKLHMELTNRKQILMVGIFQYMIGNTDFSVPVTHNIKLIHLKDSVKHRPYPVPYDFDYCGLVNAEYAVPYELLNLENIRQRLYRGFPRTIEEVEEVLGLFREKKGKMYELINGFELLTAANRRDMIKYLDEFYEIIKDPKQVKSIFITNARTE